MSTSTAQVDHCTQCVSCNSFDIQFIYNLGSAPLTDAYRQTVRESLLAEHYPLDVFVCLNCGHVQLKYQVDPQLSYQEYFYKSGITHGISTQFQRYAQLITNLYAQDPSVTLLDVGSNDGLFIQACLERNIKAFGIEPSKMLAKFANTNGRPTAHAYFSDNICDSLQDYGFPSKYNVVTFNNVLANIKNPLLALETARLLLVDNESTIIVQTGYHPEQFKKGLFDWTYHEHYSYFSIGSLAHLARRAGLYVHSYEVHPLRGGSLRMVLTQKLANHSIPYEYYTQPDHFIGLRVFMEQTKVYLNERISKLKESGLTVFGFGASHSTGILVHYTGISSDIKCLYDDNVSKHGMYMPGTALKVFPVSELIKKGPNSAVIILSWQYFDLIASKLRALGYQGQIINPVLL